MPTQHSWLDRLTSPDNRAAEAIRSLLKRAASFRGKPEQPAWVAALERANAVALGDPSETLVRSAPRTHLDESDQTGSAFVRQMYANGILPQNAREFARSNEWTRSAINKLKGRVSRADRVIVPLNPDKPFDPALQARIAFLIENPNPRMDSWRSFVEPAVEDVLTCGKGGWEYVKNFRGWPLAMTPYDCQFMKIVPGWDGASASAPRYAWGPPQQNQLGLRNDEITMILLNPTTFRWEGMPPIETLKRSIEADAAGNEFVRGMLKKYPPPGWLHLGKNGTQKQVNSVSERLTSDVLGSGSMLVTAGLDDPKFQSFWNGNSRDNELMAWSIYFARKIAAVFNISPQDFGITMDINKSSSDTQENMSAEDGFKAVLMLVEEYINREIIGKFGTPEAINLCFRFKELTLKDRARQAKLVKDMMGDVPAVMLNEARKELDLVPLEGGNVILVSTATGVSAVMGEDAEAFRKARIAEAAQMLEGEEQGEQGPPQGDGSAQADEAEPADAPAKKKPAKGKGKGEAGQAPGEHPDPDPADKATSKSLSFYGALDRHLDGVWMQADQEAAIRKTALRDWRRAHIVLRDGALGSLEAYLRLAPDGRRTTRETLEAAFAHTAASRLRGGLHLPLYSAMSHAWTQTIAAHVALIDPDVRLRLIDARDSAYLSDQASAIERAVWEGFEADVLLFGARAPAGITPTVLLRMFSLYLDHRMVALGKHIVRRAMLQAQHDATRTFLVRNPELDGVYSLSGPVREGTACSRAPAHNLSVDDVLGLNLPSSPGCVHSIVPVSYLNPPPVTDLWVGHDLTKGG